MFLKGKYLIFVLLFSSLYFFNLNVFVSEALAPPMNLITGSIDTQTKTVNIELLTEKVGKEFVVTVTDPNGNIDYAQNITPTERITKISYTTKSLVYGRCSVFAECKDEDIKYKSSFKYYVYGDVTHDGLVDSTDFSALKRYLLDIVKTMPEPEWKITADLNRDKEVNSTDYSILKRFILGVIEDIPVITFDMEKVNWFTEVQNGRGIVMMDFEGTTNADQLTLVNPVPGAGIYTVNVDSTGKFKDSLMVAYIEKLEDKLYEFKTDICVKTEGIRTITYTQKSGPLTFDLVSKTPSPTIPYATPTPFTGDQNKIDDWEYSKSSNTLATPGALGGGFAMPSATAPISSGIGFSTGGAKDINNFRENIKNNYFPQYSSLTYEGLFYDYYFDTGKDQTQTDKLFSPSYTYAISADPISGESEYYLSVGLNSGMKEEDFSRKKLNLTIVLDISGSMSSPFDKYYYDKNTSQTEDREDINKSKLEIACKSIVSLLEHLNEEDRFGMVLFDGSAYCAKPLNLVGKTDMGAIKNHILELMPQGSTNFEAGYKKGTQLFSVLENTDPNEYENRIIFLTDAMPNVGSINEESLLKLTEKNAQNKIYTTFIGVGVDFNTDLIEYITKIRGANYYSVHSSNEFKSRMDEQFEYMVTPLVFNLQLNLQSKGFKIEKVYGAPEADESTGEIMKVNTLFPSKVTNEETKGGIVLLKLKKISDDTELTLKTSYEDRNGKVDEDTVSVTFEDKKPDFYENSGIRKGIVLSRYANLLKNWMIYQGGKDSQEVEDIICSIIDPGSGIILPEDELYMKILNKWEHQSIPLEVSKEYKDLFKKFIPYMESEIGAIGDKTMEKEVDILKKLSEM